MQLRELLWAIAPNEQWKKQNLFGGNIFKPIWMNDSLLIPNEKKTFKALTCYEDLKSTYLGRATGACLLNHHKGG